MKSVKSKLRRVAIVTGGARRIGRHISYALAEEGFDIAIIYNSSSKNELTKTSARLKELNARFKFYSCDIKKIRELRKTVSRIANDFEKVDLLVNNAGVIRKMKFTELTEAVYDEILAVNLKAQLFISQAALPYLLKSDKPAIINIASLGGIKNWTEFIPYCISKSGVIKLTYLLARELAPRVRVNAIAPGTILVEGEEESISDRAAVKNIPLQRYGNPKDIVETVRFLINCEYITGQIIVVDGGRTVI